jgi:serine/threonine-protein kinase SRPK3
MAQARRYPRLEDLEKYRPGGFHPVSIGDTFAGGRYKVLHELWFGGSTFNVHPRSGLLKTNAHESNFHARRLSGLVTLKVLSAEESSKNIAADGETNTFFNKSTGSAVPLL